MKDRAVEAEGERLSSLLFVPMKNNGSAFGRFCVSNQDSADKVASQTLHEELDGTTQDATNT